MFGTAIFILNYLIHTDTKTSFTSDKSVNAMIIASSYVAARLMSGGPFLTGIPQIEMVSEKDDEGTIEDKLIESYYIPSGQVLNPAIAFGTMVISLDV